MGECQSQPSDAWTCYFSDSWGVAVGQGAVGGAESKPHTLHWALQ